MEFLAIGMPQMSEWIIILVVVLIIFGPKALPKLARSLGTSIREFKDATNKMTESIMNDEEDEPPARQKAREVEGQQARSSQPAAKDQEPEKVPTGGSSST